MLERLEKLKEEAEALLSQVNSADGLEKFRIAYLGSKGKLKEAMMWLKDASKEDRPKLGQGLNILKNKIQAGFDDKKNSFGNAAPAPKGPMVDITEPAPPSGLGRTHVLTQIQDELLEVFGRMGFDLVEGPELEDDHHNFIALNIPPEHPARDPLDNFYIDDEHLLRTQTSTVQIRVMEKTEPPIRVVALGRVYRPDTHDATHSSMFHQVEGLYVDKNVTMVDLKTTLIQFARAMFGDDAEVRIRPHYFPFTEPSAELDVKMEIRGKMQWVEIGGCGMIDPNVFEAVGYDPEVWTGFAFGLGIERIAMRRYGIGDIRWLFENDIRFLGQF